MKKQTTIAFAALVIFALSIVAFAYTKANVTENQTAPAVSCPMREKHHAAQNAAGDTEKHSCGMADCCKDGKCSMGGACCKPDGSCPMKNEKNKENAAKTDYSKITFSDSESKEDCCQSGASCCAGGAGACCKGKHS